MQNDRQSPGDLGRCHGDVEREKCSRRGEEQFRSCAPAIHEKDQTAKAADENKDNAILVVDLTGQESYTGEYNDVNKFSSRYGGKFRVKKVDSPHI